MNLESLKTQSCSYLTGKFPTIQAAPRRLGLVVSRERGAIEESRWGSLQPGVLHSAAPPGAGRRLDARPPMFQSPVSDDSEPPLPTRPPVPPVEAIRQTRPHRAAATPRIGNSGVGVLAVAPGGLRICLHSVCRTTTDLNVAVHSLTVDAVLIIMRILRDYAAGTNLDQRTVARAVGADQHMDSKTTRPLP